MKEIKVSLIVFTVVLGLMLGGCQPPIINPNQPPAIRFSHVPAIGDSESLEGTVNGVNPFKYKLTVFIFVGIGWWVKPYYAEPFTEIDWFSRWTCDIATGGSDIEANLIAVYLLPNDTELEITGVLSELPPLPEAVAFAEYNRETGEEIHKFPGNEPSEGEGEVPAEGEGENQLIGPCRGIITPTISFTLVPDICSNDWLEGTACGVEPTENVVVVYIWSGGTWRLKPSAAAPLTTINVDGTWTCNILTAGADGLATSIVAFLLPAGTEFPICEPCSILPCSDCASLPDIPGTLAFIQQDRS